MLPVYSFSLQNTHYGNISYDFSTFFTLIAPHVRDHLWHCLKLDSAKGGLGIGILLYIS